MPIYEAFVTVKLKIDVDGNPETSEVQEDSVELVREAIEFIECHRGEFHHAVLDEFTVETRLLEVKSGHCQLIG